MSKQAIAWVVSDMPDRLPELLAGAATLADKVCALVVGSEEDARRALAYGAQEVLLAPVKDDLIFEDYAPSFLAAIKATGPALVLLPATRRGKALAARLGIGLDAALINEASRIDLQGDVPRVSHMAYGGLAQSLERVNSPFLVLTVGSGIFETAATGSGQGEVRPLEVTPPARSIRRVARQPKQGSQVDLGKARRVICVGRGLGSKEALSVAEALATMLEAEVGCSRPVAEGEGWMERERYIGVSGVMLKADLYFALGVSGQIQHMVGANASKLIVAVNKDKNAPIFQCADYGLVGDLHKVIPALTEALK